MIRPWILLATTRASSLAVYHLPGCGLGFTFSGGLEGFNNKFLDTSETFSGTHDVQGTLVFEFDSILVEPVQYPVVAFKVLMEL